MNALLTRDRLTQLGLIAVAAVVLFAAVSVPQRSEPYAAAFEWPPCEHVFNDESDESRLGWLFSQTKFPSELVAIGSGPSLNCSSGFSPEDREFAVHFVFFEGDAEAKREAVRWLLYQPWEDPYRYGAQLRQRSGGDVEYFDGYVIVFSPDASEDIRRAARSAPDTEISPLMYARHGDFWATQ